MSAASRVPVVVVAGVDGCRAGWLVVMRPRDDAALAQATIVATFTEVLALTQDAMVVGVDMPIGLPATSGLGGRAADREARARLGARQSSVFAVPSRAAVACLDYRAACNASLETSSPPRMVAKQTFHLFGKIREVDAAMSTDLQQRVREVHPELAFWRLNGGQPLAEPKKVRSQPYPAGLALRRMLLERAGYSRDFLEARSFRARDAGPDDLLDAAAAAATAAAILDGTAIRTPSTPVHDERGLAMDIWG